MSFKSVPIVCVQVLVLVKDDFKRSASKDRYICKLVISLVNNFSLVSFTKGPSLYVDIESFWTEDYAGQTPNSGRELAIYVLQL